MSVSTPMSSRSRMPRPSSWNDRNTLRRKKSLGRASPLKAVPRLAARALRIGVVEPVDEMRRPGELVLGGADAQSRIALEDGCENDVAQRHPHPVIGVRER